MFSFSFSFSFSLLLSFCFSFISFRFLYSSRFVSHSSRFVFFTLFLSLSLLSLIKHSYGGEGGIQIAYAAAEKGIRPEVPQYAPEDWNRWMKRCWQDKPEDRPSFSEILKGLLEMMKHESDASRRAEFYFGTPEWAKKKPEQGTNDEKEGAGVGKLN